MLPVFKRSFSASCSTKNYQKPLITFGDTPKSVKACFVLENWKWTWVFNSNPLYFEDFTNNFSVLRVTVTKTNNLVFESTLHTFGPISKSYQRILIIFCAAWSWEAPLGNWQHYAKYLSPRFLVSGMRAQYVFVSQITVICDTNCNLWYKMS